MSDRRPDDSVALHAHPPLDDVGDPRTDLPRRWGTVWVWALAFMPWVSAVGLLWAPWSATSWHYADWVWAALLLAPYLLTLALAALDVWQLRSWQHTVVAPWAWSMLGAPVYLVVRSMTLVPRARRGLLPMWVGLANAALSLAAVVIIVLVAAALAFWFLSMMAESMGARLF